MILTAKGAIKGIMRVLLATPLLLFATVLASCQLAPAAPGPAATTAPQPAAAASLREALLAGEFLAEDLRRLGELEAQILQLGEDEPLKFGAIGTAILDIHPASLTGHYALHQFYEYLESPEAAASHGDWMAAIKADMVNDALGSPAAPYRAMTPVEAQIFVISEALSPVGAIYQSTEHSPFAMLVVGHPEEGPPRNFYFDLQGLYLNTVASLLKSAVESLSQETFESLAREAKDHAAAIGFSPLELMGMLAKSGDTAAQTAVGAMLIARKQYDDAIGWLRTASRTGNILAHVMLAQIFWEQSTQAESDEDKEQALEQVLENYLHAIALGSPDAMYALGGLYLAGTFGADNLGSGLPLLEQAGGLGHSDALLYLAHLHYAGETVERDIAQAEAYFIRSAVLDNRSAKLGYARYLMRERKPGDGDGRAVEWLKGLAQDDADPRAMLLLGNLFARGIAADQNIRAAYRWYRDAAKAAPNDADIVNEVAWTLTVSDLDRLRKERYARKIMTRMMEADEEARASPEFLDTWAATFAATGDFDEAVRLQQLALKEANEAQRDDVLDILRKHLDLFMSGKPVIEPAP